MELLSTFKQLAKEAIGFFPPVYYLQEESTKDSPALKVIYAGYSNIKLHSFGSYIYSNRPFKKKFLGFSFFLRVKDFKRKGFHPDLSLVQTSNFTQKFFRPQDGCLLPEWVNMEIDLSLPMKEMRLGKNSRFADVERLIRKNHWEYEIAETGEHDKDFYFNMYLPYVKKHNEAAVIGSYELFELLRQSSYLLLAKKNGVFCGGALVSYGEGFSLLKWIGVADANPEYLKQGIIGALYYFTVLENQRRGYLKYNLGGVGPFINNGLAKYKQGFMGRFNLEDAENRGYTLLHCREDSAVAKKFLEENPFICLGENGKLKIQRFTEYLS